MLSTTLLASVLPLLLVVQQAAAHSVSTLAVAVLKEQFKNSLLVPSAALPEFSPLGTVVLSLANASSPEHPIALKTGQDLSLNASAEQPSYTIRGIEEEEERLGGPFNSTDHKYTIITVDAGPPGANDLANSSGTGIFRGGNVVRHYLQNDLVFGSFGHNAMNLNKTTPAITEYAGPNPPAGSGPHRYVTLAYLQPTLFTPPEGFRSTLPVGVFNLPSYVASANLTLLSATYITVSVGQANTTLPQTTAVDSTTLPGYTATAAAGGTSASASASASATAGAAGQTGAGAKRMGGGAWGVGGAVVMVGVGMGVVGGVW